MKTLLKMWGVVGAVVVALGSSSCGPKPPAAAQCSAKQDPLNAGNVLVSCNGYYVVSQQGMVVTAPGTSVSVPAGHLIGLFSTSDYGTGTPHPYLWLPVAGASAVPSDLLTQQSVEQRTTNVLKQHVYVDTTQNFGSASLVGLNVGEMPDMDGVHFDYDIRNPKFRVAVLTAERGDGTQLFRTALWTSSSFWDYIGQLTASVLSGGTAPTGPLSAPYEVNEQVNASDVCGASSAFYAYGGGVFTILPDAIFHMPEIKLAIQHDSHAFIAAQALDLIDVGLTVLEDVASKDQLGHWTGSSTTVVGGLNRDLENIIAMYLLSGSVDPAVVQMALGDAVSDFLSNFIWNQPAAILCAALTAGATAVSGVGGLVVGTFCNYRNTVERTIREAYDVVTTTAYGTVAAPLAASDCAASSSGVCPIGTIDCSGTCTNTKLDDLNCGTCSNACASSGTCQAGVCASCPWGLVNCGGRCINTSNDYNNCGTCGNVCSGGATCASGSCTSACPAMGVNVLDASAHSGNTCNLANALVTDGNVAGLDTSGDGSIGVVDAAGAYPETGCVGVNFGSDYPYTGIVIRAMPSANACGLTPCGGGNCAKFDQMDVFIGQTRGSYNFVASVPLTSTTLADYVVLPPSGTSFQYAVVCRPSWTHTFDDVAVDSVNVTCN